MNRITKALYWPDPDDREILRISDSRPCEAVVDKIDGDRADLTVVDDFGKFFVRLNIAVGPSRESDRCILV